MVAGLVGTRVAEDEQRARGWAVDQTHLRPQDRSHRSLGADDGARDVEALLRQQLVQVVAGDASRDVHVARPYLIGIPVTQIPQLLVDLTLPAAFLDYLIGFFLGVAADGHAGSVMQDDVKLVYVVRGSPRHHGVDAAGVVADHAPEGSPAVGGGVRSEGEVVLGLGPVGEVVADHARLHPGVALVGVYLQDLTHILGGVDDYGDVGRLPGEARAAPARHDGCAVPIADLDGRHHVVFVAWDHHPEGRLAVVGGVVGVDGPRSRVEAHLAAHPLAQLGL